VGEHVLRRAEMGGVYRCVVEELEGMRPPGTPRLRCQDVIKTGLERTGGGGGVPELTWLKIWTTGRHLC
jgi:hypothetical protein